MSNIQIFKNEEFGQVRWVKVNGKDYAVAKDIAIALGYSNPRDAIARHCKGVVKHDDFKEGGHAIALIPEGDIYRLIVKSELPAAEKFERWIFDEVLPSIRKTGGYVNNDDLFINTYLPYADENVKAMFKSTLSLVRKQNEQIQIMKPKSDYFDALVERNLLTNFRDTAKELHIKEKVFIDWLKDNKYIYRDNKNKIKPYAKYTTDLFELKEFTKPSGYADTQTLITPKGRETFRLLLIKDGLIKEAV